MIRKDPTTMAVSPETKQKKPRQPIEQQTCTTTTCPISHLSKGDIDAIMSFVKNNNNYLASLISNYKSFNAVHAYKQNILNGSYIKYLLKNNKSIACMVFDTRDAEDEHNEFYKTIELLVPNPCIVDYIKAKMTVTRFNEDYVQPKPSGDLDDPLGQYLSIMHAIYCQIMHASQKAVYHKAKFEVDVFHHQQPTPVLSDVACEFLRWDKTYKITTSLISPHVEEIEYYLTKSSHNLYELTSQELRKTYDPSSEQEQPKMSGYSEDICNILLTNITKFSLKNKTVVTIQADQFQEYILESMYRMHLNFRFMSHNTCMVMINEHNNLFTQLDKYAILTALK